VNRRKSGTFWPSPLQEELLTVALAEPAVAVEAWTRLVPRFSLDELEPGSFALLGLVYRNLAAASHTDSLLPRLKGIYRKTWATNGLLIERTKETSSALADAGIRGLFVEGPVFAERFYGEIGLRPGSYVDVIIDAPSVQVAIAPLRAAGWFQRQDLSTERHGHRFLADDHGHLCLVRTSIAMDFDGAAGPRAAHAPLFDHAVTHDLGGHEIPVPSVSDCLLAICVAHTRGTSASRTQWIADAKMLLQTDIDWSRVVALGDAAGQTPRLAASIDYLAHVAGPLPPRQVRDQLAQTRVDMRDRLVYACTTRRPGGAGALPWLLAEHLATTRDESLMRSLGTFPRHLRDRWNLDHSWQVPIAAGRRTARLLGSRNA
jgi:Uncharacterised nucleotidyltransferase